MPQIPIIMQGGFEEPLRVGECPINDYDPEDEYDIDDEYNLDDYLDNITWVSIPEPVIRFSTEDFQRAYEILSRTHPTLIEEVENQPRLSHLEELSEKYKENVEELNY
jgi:hypothetical protein